MNRRDIVAGIGALVLTAALPSLAQTPKGMRRVGFLIQGSSTTLLKSLIDALRLRGWREGEDYRVQRHVAGEDPARWEAAARDLVEAHVDIIVAVGTHMALAAKRVTSTTPIVMMLSGYPVEAGLVASLGRPGGNVTGLRTYVDGIWGKYLELLRETVPTLRELGWLTDYVPPRFPEREFEAVQREFHSAADLLNVRLRVWRIHDSSDLSRALREVEAAPIQALFVTGGPTHSQPQNIPRIRELLLRRRLPMMNDVPGSVFMQANGLMAYAVDWSEVGPRTASFVDRILKGAKPSDLPVEQPTRFELVLNLKAAKAIGIAIPQSIRLRADRVIE